MNMNKDIKKLVTTLRKGCRRFLRIDEDQQTTLHLMEKIEDRQNILQEQLDIIQDNNVVFHKTSLSSRVKALFDDIEEQVENLDCAIYDVKDYVEDIENTLDNHINYDEHLDSEDVEDVVSGKLSSCTVDVQAKINT